MPKLIIIYLVLTVALTAWAIGGNAFRSWLRKRERCAHGVRGGVVASRCNVCTEARQREIERQKRLQALLADATKLKNQESIRLSRNFSPTLGELQMLTPQQFEDLIAEIFRTLKYTVNQTSYTNDYGRDAIMEKDDSKYLLECKKYGKKNYVGRPDIQKFHSAILVDGAKKGFFVTTSMFSPGAVIHVKKGNLPIELIDGERLLQLIAESRQSEVNNDAYQSLCTECGERVWHSLRKPKEEQCVCCNAVKPTLTIEDVLFDLGAQPRCSKCGEQMKLLTSRMRQGRHRKFWRCPRCRFSERPYRWDDDQSTAHS